MSNYLLDKEFLRQLDQNRHKEIYARVIALTFNEQPVEQIEGRVTAGSVSIDGSSAVRRTCNLTMVAKELNINNFYWGLNNKISLEIGVKNTINASYPDIIWFKQGIYVLTTFNTSISTNNYTISLSGKDKMCLLNGEVGGNLPSSIDFGSIDSYESFYTPITFTNKTNYKAHTYYVNTGTNTDPVYSLSDNEYNQNTTYYQKSTSLENTKLPIRTIIREAIHTYANEMYSNIVINDLEDYGLELLEYRGSEDTPMYLLYNENTGIYTNMTLQGSQRCYEVGTFADGLNAIRNDTTTYETTAEKLAAWQSYITQKNLVSTTLEEFDEDEFNNGVEDFNEDAKKVVFYSDVTMSIYSICKIEYGDTAGYRLTDLTYSGDLVSSVGESLTSILDKIKNMLSDFEYFYDVNGRFIFQKQKTYINTSWNTITDTEDETYVETLMDSSAASYSFIDNNLITAFQNNPNLTNLKNDYSVWGTRKGVDGDDIPIHARFAIDTKPKLYKAYDGIIYCADSSLYEDLQNSVKKQIMADLNKKLNEFTLENGTPEGLTTPTKNEDGSWTAGWWNIKDWYNYYSIVNGTAPSGTMKWYSYNGSDGAVAVSSLQNFANLNNYNFSISTRYISSYVCWLIVVNKKGRTINLQHGASSSSDSSTRECTLYNSYLDDAGVLHTVKSSPEVKKVFVTPFSGCSDTHTYLEFLKNDIEKQGNDVYFYNPQFPTIATFKELIAQEAQRELEEYLEENPIKVVDWRELIYQMAKDYYAHNQEDEFLTTVAKNNYIQQLDSNGLVTKQSYYSTGITGYEQYYSDIQGFWRQLYDPSTPTTYPSTGGYYEEVQVDTGKGDGTYKIINKWISYTEDTDSPICDYITEDYSDNVSTSQYYWNKQVVEAPEQLNFWFDFLDSAGELDQYAVSVIGDRAKSVNDKDVTAIYFRETANIIFTDSASYNSLDLKTGYTYVFITPEMENLFTISAQGKSAHDMIDTMLYNYAYCIESITITAIPVYYLEPNTRIFVRDDNSKINGDYIISKITLPLVYNGTMSITATKAVDRLY